MNSKICIVCAVILCPFVKGAQEDVGESALRERLEGLVFCPKDSMDKDGGITLESSSESLKERQEIRRKMIDQMLRMPDKFYDAIELTKIYCVDRVALTMDRENPGLGAIMATWTEGPIIAFTKGYEHTLFHELGHAIDRVRVNDNHDCSFNDPLWIQFYRTTRKSVDQEEMQYINKRSGGSAWKCTANADGSWDDVFPGRKGPELTKKYFIDDMSTHYDGCYAMGAEFEDRQELLQAILNPKQRYHYLLSDDGPRGGNKCKCTTCKRDFAPMSEDAKLGNRFAVIRAKSWWQFFTMNQNTNIVNEETRNSIWAFDEKFQYSGPYVLKSNEFFLDPVRFSRLTKDEVEKLSKFVYKKYGGQLQIVSAEEVEEKETESVTFSPAFIVLPKEEENIKQRNTDFRKDLEKLGLKIFTITYEDLGYPILNGVNQNYTPKEYLKEVESNSHKWTNDRIVQEKTLRARRNPFALSGISAAKKKRRKKTATNPMLAGLEKALRNKTSKQSDSSMCSIILPKLTGKPMKRQLDVLKEIQNIDENKEEEDHKSLSSPTASLQTRIFKASHLLRNRKPRSEHNPSFTASMNFFKQKEQEANDRS